MQAKTAITAGLGAATLAAAAATAVLLTQPTIVSTPTQLLAALAKAKPGDTILDAGNLGPVTINGINIAAPGVTIRTAPNAANVKAILGNTTVNASSGITFAAQDFQLTGLTADQSGQVKVTNSQRITFTNDHFHGPAGPFPAAAQTGPGLALNISTSDLVSVLESEFDSVLRGVNLWQATHFLIRGNNFHDIGSDGIDGETSGPGEIAANRFDSFWPKGNYSPTGQWISGDHPDSIQFWTANTKAPSVGISVHDNIMTRGKSNAVRQCVFETDQSASWSPALNFQGVSIVHNFCAGSNGNGIDVSGGCGVTIQNNELYPFPDQPAWIRYDHVHSGASGDPLVAGCPVSIVGNTVKTSTDQGVSELAAFQAGK